MKALKTFVLLCAVMFSSCGHIADELREGVRVEGVEQVVEHGTVGADLHLRVENRTSRRLKIKEAELDIFFGERHVGQILLHEAVFVERHSDGVVSSRWKFRFPDRMRLYSLKQKILRSETSQIRVNYRVKGRCGWIHANISARGVTFSEFLNTFGVDTEDLKKYLE